MRKCKFLRSALLVLAVSMLAGCGRKTNGTDAAKIQSERAVQKVGDLTGCSYTADTQDGFYYVINDILYFYDYESGLNTPMCSRVECAHNDETCDAYANCIHAWNNDDLTAVCEGRKVIYDLGYIYMIERTEDDESILYQYDSGFGNKKKIVKLAGVEGDVRTKLQGASSLAVADGYIYYYAAVYSEDVASNGNLVEYQCRRASLSSGSEPEVFDKFDYPYDYSMAKGDNEGKGVFASGEYIYYVAVGSQRWYTTENQVQANIGRYNTADGSYERLYSYVGNDRQAILGADAGYMNYVSMANYMCMDNDGNMYIMTSSEDMGETDKIVKYNPISGESSIIYHKTRNELISPATDGEYLYFWDTDDDESVYVATNLDGTVVGEMKLRYRQDFLDKFETHKKMFPDSTAVKAYISDTDEKVYGVSGKYIVLAFGYTDDMFEGITMGSNALDLYLDGDMGIKDFYMAVALIDKEKLVNGEDVYVEQIYTYNP